MIDLVKYAVSKLREVSPDYADIRITDLKEEKIETKNNEVLTLDYIVEKGAGIRVLLDGFWGYCSVNTLDESNILKAIEKAIDVSRKSRSEGSKRVKLIPQKAVTASYKNEYKINPLEVGQDEKIDLLYKLNNKMIKTDEVSFGESSMKSINLSKYYGNTDGSLIDQHFVIFGYGLQATAIRGSDMQIRTSGGLRENIGKMGYEIVDDKFLMEEAGRISADARALLDAPVCPGKKADLIIMPDQMMLQIHESIGHALELDRIYNSEIGYAGGSFVKPEMLNKFQYGSSIVNVTSDTTIPTALGTVGYDDYGVPAKRVYLIKEGILSNFISCRESAHLAGLDESSGNSIAISFKRFPIVRMTSVNLEPGNSTLEEMIEATEDGFVFETNKSWSIDDIRWKFQFGCEVAYEIKNGRKEKMYKNPNYNGITPEFWNSCVAIGKRELGELHCTPNCGKGQPGQSAFVGHFSPPAKFRDVNIFGV